jgi:hypothetical protein
MWKDRKQGKRIIFHCSFCGKGKDQVEQLIAGPGGVYICNNCIHLCQQILQEKQTDREPETVAEMSSLLLCGSCGIGCLRTFHYCFNCGQKLTKGLPDTLPGSFPS